MQSCPECNADQKYTYTEPLGGDVVGFFCGAVTIRLCPTGTPHMRKKCDYRPPKQGAVIIGVDLASGPDRCMWINPETGLPEAYPKPLTLEEIREAAKNCPPGESIREKFEELYKKDPLE